MKKPYISKENRDNIYSIELELEIIKFKIALTKTFIIIFYISINTIFGQVPQKQIIHDKQGIPIGSISNNTIRDKQGIIIIQIKK